MKSALLAVLYLLSTHALAISLPNYKRQSNTFTNLDTLPAVGDGDGSGNQARTFLKSDASAARGNPVGYTAVEVPAGDGGGNQARRDRCAAC